MEKYIIFGTGVYGKEALTHIGNNRVAYFCDNDTEKVGTQIMGKKVISVNQLSNLSKEYIVVIAIKEKSFVRRQLEDKGICNYIVYVGDEQKKEKFIKEGDLSQKEQIDDRLDYYILRSREIDPINNYYGFRELVKEMKSDKTFSSMKFFQTIGRATETVTYGHFRCLTQYANMRDVEPEIFPRIAHGAFFFDNYTYNKTATIYASEFLKKQMNDRYPYIPVFSVGSYINYTKVEGEFTETNADTVMVYLDHSVEDEYVKYEKEELYNKIFAPLKRDYKQIIVCVYWYDIDEELYDWLSKKGIKIVSSGFRFDDQFIFRTRIILNMADDVVVYGRTSALIYALCLDKKVYYYGEVDSHFKDKFCGLNHITRYEEIDAAIEEWEPIVKKNFGKRYSEYIEDEKKILNYYFGINIKKCPNDFKMMYSVCRDIWDNCDYIEEHYPLGVYKTWWQYQKDYNFDKLTILSEALGRGFWNI